MFSLYNLSCRNFSINSSVNIAMRKVKCSDLRLGMISQKCKEKVKFLIANDKAFNFMNTLNGAPAYWKRFQLEVLAMTEQLGLTNIVQILSSAEENDFLTEEEIQNMHYSNRTKILISNHVPLAKVDVESS